MSDTTVTIYRGDVPVAAVSVKHVGFDTAHSITDHHACKVTCTGIVLNDHLRSEWLNQKRLNATAFVYPDGSAIRGDFFLKAYAEVGNHNDEVVFEAIFVSSGAVTYGKAELNLKGASCVLFLD